MGAAVAGMDGRAPGRNFPTQQGRCEGGKWRSIRMDTTERMGQSTKTESVHRVPLHPDVAAFVAYANSRPGEWIFGEFTRHPIKGRGHYLSQVFTSFRRKHVSDSPKKTLHSLRHRFKDVLDNADISLERQRVLRGACATEVIQKYGQGAGLRKLWVDVQKLKPFED